jgi:hypothetical protein
MFAFRTLDYLTRILSRNTYLLIAVRTPEFDNSGFLGACFSLRLRDLKRSLALGAANTLAGKPVLGFYLLTAVIALNPYHKWKPPLCTHYNN